MTQIAYQTDGGIKKLLTKSGGLCTTCCSACENTLISSVKVSPGNTLTYTGLQGDGIAPMAGYWRLFANRPGVYGWLIDSNVVTASGRLASLWSKYTNSSLVTTYFDLTFSCDGVIYLYTFHSDIEAPINFAWGGEITRGQSPDFATLKPTFEPYMPGVYSSWKLFADVVWESYPDYITHAEFVDSGLMYNGYFQALQDTYGFGTRYNPSTWVLAVYA